MIHFQNQMITMSTAVICNHLFVDSQFHGTLTSLSFWILNGSMHWCHILSNRKSEAMLWVETS